MEYDSRDSQQDAGWDPGARPTEREEGGDDGEDKRYEPGPEVMSRGSITGDGHRHTFRLPLLGRGVNSKSCLIQDEPGRGSRFSYKMSLERRSVMLGIESQRAKQRGLEPGGDPGILESQR